MYGKYLETSKDPILVLKFLSSYSSTVSLAGFQCCTVCCNHSYADMFASISFDFVIYFHYCFNASGERKGRNFFLIKLPILN